MKILTRKQFMDMPIGTVFSYYEPCNFRDLMIKRSDTTEWENDFLFDEEQLYAIYEKNDIKDLIIILEKLRIKHSVR